MKDNKNIIEALLEIVESVMESVTECISTQDYAEVIKHRPTGITRRVDLVAEESLEAVLSERGICARIVSEELGERIVPTDGEPICTLVFDPVDGSTNAISGIPFFCTSLAYSSKINDVKFDDIEAGVVRTFTGKTYHAIKGGGAYLDGKKIIPKKNPAKRPVISIYTYGVPEVPQGVIELGKKVIARTLGSIAMEMCLVAEGVTDGLVDVRKLINGYDIMASMLVLKEAGGILTDNKGREINEDVGVSNLYIVGAMEPEMHEMILLELSR
ncbi:MAG: inositol monophosphatase family protein [Halobacteriota archaeon]|nr:inositol monophosphatase family protein [Halobacteriota archaeon]